jgi:hypothetical protein
MATLSHEPAQPVERKRRWSELLVAEMWTSLAIAVIWLAVLFEAVFGPDIVTRGVAGDTATVPSAVAVAPFAFFATWAVAKYGFRCDRKRD